MGEPKSSIDTAELALGVQSLGIGVAVADAKTWSVIFENAKFGQWFPAEANVDAALSARISGVDTERASARLAQGLHRVRAGLAPGPP